MADSGSQNNKPGPHSRNQGDQAEQTPADGVDVGLSAAGRACSNGKDTGRISEYITLVTDGREKPLCATACTGRSALRTLPSLTAVSLCSRSKLANQTKALLVVRSGKPIVIEKIDAGDLKDQFKVSLSDQADKQPKIELEVYGA
jgi:hypothetical protein